MAIERLEEKKTIRHVFHGGSEDVSYAEFRDWVIQDESVAEQVAQTMIENGLTYQWNADAAEFYEEFEIIDRDGLLRQLSES